MDGLGGSLVFAPSKSIRRGGGEAQEGGHGDGGETHCDRMKVVKILEEDRWKRIVVDE